MAESTRVAVVTGANKGIGRHAAHQLAQQGLVVYLGSRDADRGEVTAAALAAEGLDVRLLLLDVTDAASIAAAVSVVETDFDHLDVLVNNAGISTGFAPPTVMTLDDLRKTFETNVFGVVETTNAFLPLLRRSPAARVVNVSSGAGSIARAAEMVGTGGGVSAAAYRASKAALNVVTLCYATEFRETKMKFNVINPGFRATDLPGIGVVLPGSLDPAGGAEIIVKMALLDESGPNGGFFDDDGTTLPW